MLFVFPRIWILCAYTCHVSRGTINVVITISPIDVCRPGLRAPYLLLVYYCNYIDICVVAARHKINDFIMKIVLAPNQRMKLIFKHIFS